VNRIRINGNIGSLKKSILEEIDSIYDLEIPRGEFLPQELAFILSALTMRINREISVYINRKGIVVDVSIGDSSTVSLPEVEGRRNKYKLSGVRCIHTHPSGDGQVSIVDVNSLLKLRLDAMVAIGVKENEDIEIYAALPKKGFEGVDIYGPFTADDGRLNTLFKIIDDIDKSINESGTNNIEDSEKAILVGLETSPGEKINGKTEGERLLEELEELALTAGVVVVKKVLQRRKSKDSAFYVGKGMIEQLNLLRQALDVNVLIFDDELSGSQVRNIEEVTGIKVIDRATLILDIFAQRARSKEGKIQVELAQLKYRLPRLMGMGIQLSRLGGGIGTRGPGEKKLEVDRRHIKRRITSLETELDALGKRRELMREGRRKNSVATVALVGYTNTGKSTLLNKLCNSDVFVENKLFATLDPAVRNLNLPDGREVLLIDTVGFIRKLPHDLVEAFKSTLEEAVFADLLLHVVDVSSEDVEMQINVVRGILEELGAVNKPTAIIFNKMDLVDSEIRLPHENNGYKYYEVSAATGKGLDELKDGITQMLPISEVEMDLEVPYSVGWVIPYIHQHGKILSEEYAESFIRLKATIKNEYADKLSEYFISH